MKIMVDSVLTYESDIPVSIGDIVELPANNFSKTSWLGEVTALTSDYDGDCKKIITNHGAISNEKTLAKYNKQYKKILKSLKEKKIQQELRKQILLSYEKSTYRKVIINEKYSIWSCKIKLSIGDRVIVRKLHGDKKNWVGVVTELQEGRDSLDYEVNNIILEKETDDDKTK